MKMYGPISTMYVADDKQDDPDDKRKLELIAAHACFHEVHASRFLIRIVTHTWTARQALTTIVIGGSEQLVPCHTCIGQAFATALQVERIVGDELPRSAIVVHLHALVSPIFLH